MTNLKNSRIKQLGFRLLQMISEAGVNGMTLDQLEQEATGVARGRLKRALDELFKQDNKIRQIGDVYYTPKWAAEVLAAPPDVPVFIHNQIVKAGKILHVDLCHLLNKQYGYPHTSSATATLNNVFLNLCKQMYRNIDEMANVAFVMREGEGRDTTYMVCTKEKFRSWYPGYMQDREARKKATRKEKAQKRQEKELERLVGHEIVSGEMPEIIMAMIKEVHEAGEVSRSAFAARVVSYRPKLKPNRATGFVNFVYGNAVRLMAHGHTEGLYIRSERRPDDMYYVKYTKEEFDAAQANKRAQKAQTKQAKLTAPTQTKVLGPVVHLSLFFPDAKFAKLFVGETQLSLLALDRKGEGVSIIGVPELSEHTVPVKKVIAFQGDQPVAFVVGAPHCRIGNIERGLSYQIGLVDVREIRVKTASGRTIPTVLDSEMGMVEVVLTPATTGYAAVSFITGSGEVVIDQFSAMNMELR